MNPLSEQAGRGQNVSSLLQPSNLLRKRPSTEAGIGADIQERPRRQKTNQDKTESLKADIRSEQSSDEEDFVRNFRASRKHERNNPRPGKKWVRRFAKCCECDRISSVSNKCECGKELCGKCFRYEGPPGVEEDLREIPLGEIPEITHDDLWEIVREMKRNMYITVEGQKSK